MSIIERLRTQESKKEKAEKAGKETRKAEKKYVESAAEQKEDQKKQQEKQQDQHRNKATALNPEQEYAVRCTSPHIAVKAGPGTGKTKTLVSRLRYLLEYRKVRSAEITAVTFTNQAAAEMRTRIERETGKKQAGRTMQIGTFHSICLNFLKEQGEEFTLMGEAQQRLMAEEVLLQEGLDGRPA